MTDNVQILEQLELAERATPHCAVCSAPTVPVVDGEGLWLECSAHQAHPERPSLLRRLLTLDLAPHTRFLVVADSSLGEPAARRAA